MEIDIDSTTHLADVAAGPIDLAVRYFEAATPEAPPGCALSLLFRMQAFPAAAPDVAAGLTGGRGGAEPADIARLPLIHEDGREAWRAWFNAAGLPPPAARAGLLVNDLAHGVIAAEQGAGVVLVDNVLGEDALAAGRLVALSALSIPIGGYWLVRPSARPASRPARAFAAWIAARLAADGPASRAGRP